MNTATPPSEHQEVWELLPWLVTERLSEPDRRRVEAHLHECAACRAECAAQRQIHEAMATADAGSVERMPMTGLKQLRERIANADRAKPAFDVKPAPDVRSRPRPGAIAAAVLAAGTALAIYASTHWQIQRHDATAEYRTVTTDSPQRAGAVIRAVFAPTLTLSGLQALLDDAHLRIVSGPTEAGVYSLAMSGPQSIDWSLHRLRESGTVRFAEAIGPASAAPPR